MPTEKWSTPSPANPFEKGSAAYWAWEGWQAALQYDPPTKDKK